MKAILAAALTGSLLGVASSAQAQNMNSNARQETTGHLVNNDVQGPKNMTTVQQNKSAAVGGAESNDQSQSMSEQKKAPTQSSAVTDQSAGEDGANPAANVH